MSDKDQHKSALKISSGVEQIPSISLDALKKVKGNKKEKLSVNDYISGILSGNIAVLSQAITLIESSLPLHRAIAQQIIEICQKHSGNSLRIGITGVPGVGKSTLI
jgi:LAO/AO transport system kinase